MQSIKGEICTIKDMNRINKKRNHCQFGDDPFAVTLRIFKFRGNVCVGRLAKRIVERLSGKRPTQNP